MNDQRKAIFGQRLDIMQAEDLSEIIADMRHQVAEDLVDFSPAAEDLCRPVERAGSLCRRDREDGHGRADHQMGGAKRVSIRA